jgi:hypothetical protein
MTVKFSCTLILQIIKFLMCSLLKVGQLNEQKL